MTNNTDAVTGDIKIRFDQKPTDQTHWDLIADLKKYGCKWTGFGDDGKWVAPAHAVMAFEDKAFRARVKLACCAISFYDHKGQGVSMEEFITAAKDFDPDAVDDDLSTLRPSQVPPDTPSKKTKRDRD